MRKIVPVLALAVALGAAVAVSPPATSRPIEGGTVDESFDLVHEDFCGVPGLTVTDVGTVHVRFRVTTRGRARIPYYAENLREEGTVTDVSTGRWVTFSVVTNGKDLHVTDNGDGTVTVVAFGTGNFTISDADGKVLARNPGQFRERILIDTNGTFHDLFDDEFLGQLEVLKQSTGRNDDTCDAMLAGLGIDAG